MTSEPARQPPQTLGAGKIIGCIVAALAGGLLVIAGVFALFFFFMYSAMRGEPYRVAVVFLKSHPAVVATTGTPMEEGFFPNGNVVMTGSTGHARYSISLSGPRGEGVGAVESDLAGGRWRVSAASWTSRGMTVDLLPPP